MYNNDQQHYTGCLKNEVHQLDKIELYSLILLLIKKLYKEISNINLFLNWKSSQPRQLCLFFSMKFTYIETFSLFWFSLRVQKPFYRKFFVAKWQTSRLSCQPMYWIICSVKTSFSVKLTKQTWSCQIYLIKVQGFE